MCCQYIEFLFGLHKKLFIRSCILLQALVEFPSFCCSLSRHTSRFFWLTVFNHLSHVFYSTHTVCVGHISKRFSFLEASCGKHGFNESSVADRNWLRKLKRLIRHIPETNKSHFFLLLCHFTVNHIPAISTILWRRKDSDELDYKHNSNEKEKNPDEMG